MIAKRRGLIRPSLIKTVRHKTGFIPIEAMAESPIMGVYAVGTAMSDRWLSVEEIAEYLGVSRDTVYAWIGKKDMPAHKVGRFWKFKADEVDEWVRSGKASEEPDDASSR